MLSKLSPALVSLIIAGLLIFLVLFRFLPRGAGKPITLLLALAIAFVVFRLVFNLPGNWIKYLWLGIGLLCVAALIVYFLALSGSDLLYQNTRESFNPQYDDPVLTELYGAFHRGKVGKWKKLLQSHPDRLHHKQFLDDILRDVVEDSKSNERKLEALKYMLDAGAKIDSSLCHNFTQIAYTGKVDFTELLLQHGADPNCASSPGSKTPLFDIIGGLRNEEKIIEVLVRHGADVNAKIYLEQFKENLTPLLFAAYLGYWRCCKAFLENGADLNYKNKDGISVKDYLLQMAKNPDNLEYYKTPDFLQLIEQIKQY
ncbi:MAG: ankyrin repeat domain-containing protein [Saprospiraceae bacterium]|nr:ankyrin repeat domain-containing protein [Saprospiraceae bacterium]